MSARNLPGTVTNGIGFRRCCLLLLGALLSSPANAAVYLTSYVFNQTNPPQVYTDETMPAWYRLRVRIYGVPGYGAGFDAATTFNNDWVALQALPNPGTYSATLYWVKYDSTGTNVVQTGADNFVTVSIRLPDTTAPTVPTRLVASNFATNSVTVSWDASFDALGVTGYEVFRGSTSLGTVATPSMNVTGLIPGTAYEFRVRARDAAGNWSGQSTALSANTVLDTVAPSQPGNLTSSSLTPVSVTVSWSASSDNTAVTGYEVFRNSASIGRVSGTSYTISGLSPSTSYQLQVRALDGAGNASSLSSTLNVTTPAPDTTIPTVPTNVAVTSLGATTVTLTWSASTDNIGVTGYEVFRNGTSAGVFAGTSATLTGLTELTVYTFTVRAKDGSNNWSATSSPLTVRTWDSIIAWFGTIYSNASWDWESEQWYYNPSSDYYYFNLPSSGSIRAYATGTTDTRGSLDYEDASSGGAGNNFLFSTTTIAGSHLLIVAGEYEDTEGEYNVVVEFKGPNQSPTASFVATPQVGRAPLTVALDGSASADPDGQIAGYSWDFDNNGTMDATGVTATATLANSGTAPVTQTIKLTVTDLDGSTANTTRTVTVYPASSFGISVNNGTSSQPFQQSGATISLTANTPPFGMQFAQWVVVSGSGSFASATSASTTFTVGSADTVVQATYVADTVAPSAPTGITVSNITGDSMSVAWSAATDNVGVSEYLVYRNGVLAGTVTGTSATIGYLASSTVYQVTVRAKDLAGNASAHSKAATAKTWIRVFAATGTIYNGWHYDEETEQWSYAPSEDVYYPWPPAAGNVKVFTRGTTNTSGETAFIGLWETASDGGEGSNFLISGTVSANGGTVWVRGEYEDVEGDYQLFVDLDPSANVAPSALFTATPALGRAPLQVSFDGSAAYDAEGPIASYAWDLDNNGTTDATGQRASQTYSNSGTTPVTATVKFTVTDMDAVSSFTTQNVTVYPATSFSIQVEGGTTSAPFQQVGATVDLVASPPPIGLQFGGWTLVSGAGTFGNATLASTTFTVGSADSVVKATYVPDTTAPNVPTGFFHSNVLADSATVQWSAPSDNVGVVAYEVWLNGSLHSVVSSPAVTLRGLTPWTPYQVTVRARDAAGNLSAMSSAFGVRTWQRLYTNSGWISNGQTFDEETQTYVYNPTSEVHSFSVSSAGTVRSYARGSTDTWGWRYPMGDPMSGSGGDGSNFLLEFPASAGWTAVEVYGEYQETDGPYDVFVDFYPSSSPTVADFVATPSVGRAPLAVQLNGATSSDWNGTINSYAWDFDNDNTTDATGQSASTTYGNTGSTVLTYTAKLAVVGTSGTANTTRTVTVYPASYCGVAVQYGTVNQPFQQTGGTVTLTAVAPPNGGSFLGWIVVSGSGTFANASASPTTFTLGGGDTVVRAVYGADTSAPTAPANLNFSERTAKTVTLVWSPASDNIGVCSYLVYRGTTHIGTTPDLTFFDPGLTANTAYSYTVKAADSAGNLSVASNTLNVTTTQDFSADSDQDGIPNAIESALGSYSSSAGTTDTTNQTQLNVQRPIK